MHKMKKKKKKTQNKTFINILPALSNCLFKFRRIDIT